MTDGPANRPTTATQGGAADTPSDLWLGRQLWWRRVERAGVTTGASGVLRQAHQGLPLLAALLERRDSATAHLGRNADRAAMTAPSVRILESADIGTEAAGMTTPHAPVSGRAPASTPPNRSGAALPLAAMRPSSPTQPAHGKVIQRRAVAANPDALPRTASVATVGPPARTVRLSAAVAAPQSGAAPRRAGPHRVGAPIKSAVAELGMRPPAGRPMPEQSHDATRAEPLASAAVVSPNASTAPVGDLPAARVHLPAGMRSEATTAAGHRPQPASAAAAHQATAPDIVDARPHALRAAARPGPTRIGQAQVTRPKPPTAEQIGRMAPKRSGAVPAPRGTIAAPVAPGSWPALHTLPVSVPAATTVIATASVSPRRQAAMPMPPAATVAQQPVQHAPLEGQAGIRPQVRSVDAAPTSTVAPSGSIAARSTEQVRLGTREIGRVAESVYQLLVDRLAQERQRRGA